MLLDILFSTFIILILIIISIYHHIISNGFERFWVELKEIKTLYLIGRVDNELITNEYNFNDYVMFEKKNIYDIHTIKDKEDLLKNLNRKIKFLYKQKKKK